MSNSSAVLPLGGDSYEPTQPRELSPLEKDISGESHSTLDKVNISLSAIFTKNNGILAILFLAIYIISYITMSMFSSTNRVIGSTSNVIYSGILDLISIFFIGILVIYLYYIFGGTDHTVLLLYILKVTRDTLEDPNNMLLAILAIVGTYVVKICIDIIFVGAASSSYIFSIIEYFNWSYLGTILIINFLEYIMGVPVIDMMITPLEHKLLPPIIDLSGVSMDIPVKTVPIKNEVFSVSNNLYNYDDARSICSAYDASLASYDQVEEAYSMGGEWCNYGWSEGQMALFPTQKSTWVELQKDEVNKHSCGRPGINGGYISNPYMKFGVNCFGKKPAPSDTELARMKENVNRVRPKTEKDQIIDAKVDYWKKNASKFLDINSFDKMRWSEYGENNIPTNIGTPINNLPQIPPINTIPASVPAPPMIPTPAMVPPPIQYNAQKTLI
jgi:hypothetical protein